MTRKRSPAAEEDDQIGGSDVAAQVGVLRAGIVAWPAELPEAPAQNVVDVSSGLRVTRGWRRES